jgi:hypothetical protein
MGGVFMPQPSHNDAEWLRTLASEIKTAYGVSEKSKGTHKTESEKFAKRLQSESDFGNNPAERFSGMADLIKSELQKQVRAYTGGFFGSLAKRTPADFIQHINKNNGHHYSRLLLMAAKELQENYGINMLQGLDKLNVKKELKEQYNLSSSPVQERKEQQAAMKARPGAYKKN